MIKDIPVDNVCAWWRIQKKCMKEVVTMIALVIARQLLQRNLIPSRLGSIGKCVQNQCLKYIFVFVFISCKQSGSE